MRINSTGNLTVLLIRMQRFDIGCQPPAEHDPHCHHRPATRCDHPPRTDHHCRPHHHRDRDQHQPCQTDRVQFSRAALSYDPWSFMAGRDDYLSDFAGVEDKPACMPSYAGRHRPMITPVLGSPALAGLGIALIVPGTLLDVVA